MTGHPPVQGPRARVILHRGEGGRIVEEAAAYDVSVE
jgi:hypothetical protein